MTLLFMTITNNLFMHVQPGEKLLFCRCLRVPEAKLEEKGAAGLQFVFLRGRKITLLSAT